MSESLASTSGKYRLIRTIRVRNDNVPGVLGALASAIGRVDASIGNIQMVHLGQHHVVRDIEIMVFDDEHLKKVLQEISDTRGVSVLEVRDEVLDLHRGGKIKVVSAQPINSIDRLRKVYTPGVADVCRTIREDLEQRNLYTCIPNLIAIVTDGTRVLGLGNMGPWPAMPVMEGKAALLSEMVGVSGIPILLDTTDPDETVRTVKHISLTFGGIHLEDIASPRCFEVSEKLSRELDIPVMHDDQDGTAAVVLAAVFKACRIVGVELKNMSIGQVGLGASGMGIAQLVQHYTGNPVLGTDLAEERMRHLESRGGRRSTLAEIMAKADIVIATTGVRGLIPPQMVRKGQVILALSNPEPEIEPAVALEHGAALAADGRSVNNLLGYPGIWRGALDSRAARITREMLLAASRALVEIGKPDEILPFALDREVHRAVAQAVARAAIDGGVARRALDEDYFETGVTRTSSLPS
ncbi:MAG: NAD-dependent malic enzyme [Chloroflexi bacterium]|nr:NAD-dependent malic enzyme [Chloroflexota bacterium]